MKSNKYSNQKIVTIAVYIPGLIVWYRDYCKQADEMALDVLDGKRTSMISDSNTWDALSNARKKNCEAKEKNTDSYLLTEEGIQVQKNISKVKSFDQSK